MSFPASPSYAPAAGDTGTHAGPETTSRSARPQRPEHQAALQGAPGDPHLYGVKGATLIFGGVIACLTAIFGIVEYGTRDLKQSLVRIEDKMGQMNSKIDVLGTKMTHVEWRLDKIETRLDKVETRLDKVETRLDKVETHLGKVETRLGKIETRAPR